MRHLFVVLIFFISMSFMFFILDRTVLKTQGLNKKQIQSCDSAKTELFVLKTQLMRYELAIGILAEEDSVAANKLTEIYNHETE
jgi:membrane-anchored glycerophosphoryl diester phosphodiesterase (GDPDase)